MILKKRDFHKYHLQTLFDDILIIDNSIDFFTQFETECDDKIDESIC